METEIKTPSQKKKLNLILPLVLVFLSCSIIGVLAFFSNKKESTQFTTAEQYGTALITDFQSQIDTEKIYYCPSTTLTRRSNGNITNFENNESCVLLANLSEMPVINSVVWNYRQTGTVSEFTKTFEILGETVDSEGNKGNIYIVFDKVPPDQNSSIHIYNIASITAN